MTAPVATTRASYLRYKVRRLVGLLLALAGVTVGGHALVRHFLDQHLETAIRAVDARTHGWRLEDLQHNRAPVPETDNAAPVVRAVVEQLPQGFPQQLFAGTSLPPQGDPLGRTGGARARTSSTEGA